MFAVSLMLNVIPAAAEETDPQTETDNITEVIEEILPKQTNEETEPIADTENTEDDSDVKTDQDTEENQEEITSESEKTEIEENNLLEEEGLEIGTEGSESDNVSDGETADDLIPADGQSEADEASPEISAEAEQPAEDSEDPIIEEEDFGDTETYNVLQDDLPDYNEKNVTYDVDIKVGQKTYKPDDFSEDMLLLIFFGSKQVEYTEQLVTECENLIHSGISLKLVLMLREETDKALLSDLITKHPSLMVSDNYNVNYSYAYQLYNEFGLNGKLYPVSFLMNEERQFISGCNGLCDISRMTDRIRRWAAEDHSFAESENKVFQVTIQAAYHQDEARSMFDMINEFRTGDEAWAWNNSNTEKQYYSLYSLKYDYYLEYLAMIRAKEIISYYDPLTHCSPNGTFNTRLLDPGVYENCGYGFNTAAEAFEYWKADNYSYSGQTSRRNMLDRVTMAVGIACIEYNGKKYWVQEFDNKMVSSTPVTDIDQAEEHTVDVDRETVSLYFKFNDDRYNNSPEIRLYKGASAELPSAEAYFYTNSESSIYAGAVNNVRSSNEDVAVVSGNKIIAKNPGTASIIYEGVFHELKGSITLNVTVDQKTIPLQSIKLNKSSLSLEKGKSQTLKVTYMPTDTTDNKTVTWTSSNKSVATVNSAGKVTAVGAGTTTITALVGTKTATCKVTVKVPLESISLNKKSMNVVTGKTGSLSVKYNPTDTTDSRTITWSTSDKTVATVSSTGKVTGKKPGKATITAKTAGGLKDQSSIRVLFSDVTNKDDFFYTYVYDLFDQGIVGGYDDGTFRPYNACNRAAVVTFLWRAADKPEPSKMAKFKDMTGNPDFDKAISWALEEGITTGYDDGTFRPYTTCNRAAIITFLWRYAGKPSVKTTNAFSDLTGNIDFDKAISWGVEEGITTGYSDGTFRPWNTCNRLAIVSFLARYKGL